MANERTYLAWLKTSLVFVSVGIALAQFNRFVEGNSHIIISGLKILLEGNPALMKAGKPYGSVCVILGIIILLLGTFRFYYVQAALLEKKFPVANYSTLFMALAAMVCIGLFLASAAKM